MRVVRAVATSLSVGVHSEVQGMCVCVMMSFQYNYQNALRQAIVFRIFFFYEESLVRDSNLKKQRLQRNAFWQL